MKTRFHSDVIPYFTIENLPNEDMRTVAKVVGFDVAIRLINSEIAGQDLHVPVGVPRTIVQNFCNDHADLKMQDIARAFGVSERSVYNYIRQRY